MEYIGHSSIYYKGTNGYRVCSSDDGSFYSIYFDSLNMPVLRILAGKKNVISRLLLNRASECDTGFIDFDVNVFVDLLIYDLEKEFKIKVDLVI